MATGRRISIVVDEQGINRVVKGLNDVEKSSNLVTRGFKNVLSGLKSVGDWIYRYRYRLEAAALGLFYAIIKPYAALEENLARVRVQLGATGEEIQSLQDLANQLGTTTYVSAVEASQGMLALAKSGMDVKDIVTQLPTVIDFAEVANTDLAGSLNLVTEGLLLFELEATESARVADVFGKGASMAKVGVDSLVGALDLFAVSAHDMGYSLETSVAMLDVLAQRGIRGQRAGTGMRLEMQAFQDLISTSWTPEQEKIVKRLGLSGSALLTDIKGGKLDFLDFLSVLKTSGATVADMAGIFGRAATVAYVLAEAGKDGVEKYAQALRDAGGYTKEAAATIGDTLNGKWKEIKNSLQTLGNTLAESVAPGLKSFLDQTFRPWVNDLITIWNDKNKTFREKWVETMSAVQQAMRDSGPVLAQIVSSTMPAIATAAMEGLVAALGPIGLAAFGGALAGGAPPSLALAMGMLAPTALKGWAGLFKAAVDSQSLESLGIQSTPSRDTIAARNLPATGPFGGVATAGMGPLSEAEKKAGAGYAAFAGAPLADTKAIEANAAALEANTKAVEGNTDAAQSGGGLGDYTDTGGLLGALLNDQTFQAVIGPLQATLMSAVTDPITSSLEKYLKPVSNRIGDLADAGLRWLDWPMSLIGRGIEVVTGLLGGPNYKQGRYTGEGAYAMAPAGGGGGNFSVGGSAIHVQNMNVTGYKDGKAAGEATVQEIARYHEIASTQQARSLKAGMVKREAQER